MKKFFVASIVAVLAATLFVLDAARAQAAYPPKDTWVLTWDGTSLFVKAGSLDYTPSHVDAAPEFGFTLIINGDEARCYFRARGYAVLYVEGEMVGDSHSNRFVEVLYNSICEKLIHRR